MDPNVQKGFLMGYGYWNSLLNNDDYFRDQVDNYYRRRQDVQPLEVPKVYNPSVAPEFAGFNEMVRENSLAAYRQANIPMHTAMMYAAISPGQLPLGVPQLQYTLPPAAQVFTPVRAGIAPQLTPFAYSAQFTDVQDAAYNYQRARLGASFNFGTEFAKLTASAVAGAAIGGGVPGLIGGTLTYLGATLLEKALTAPFSLHMREAERMQQATSYVVTGTTSPLGRGLNVRAAAELGLRGQYMAETVGGMGYRDVEEIIRLGGSTGLFTWAQDVDAITRNLRQTIKLVGRIAQMTNDPDIRRHIADIAQLQQMGVLPSEAMTVYSAGQMASRITGVGIRSLMETSGAYGAQTFNALNLLPGAGISYGLNAAAAARMAMATGNISPLMSAFLGGPEGIVQRNVNMQAAFLSAFSELAMPNMLMMSGGNLAFNKNAMMAYLSGKNSFMDMITGQTSALANMSKTSGVPYAQLVTDYLLNKNLLKSEYMKAAGENPLVTDLNMLMGVSQIRRMNPNIGLEMAALIMSGGDINDPEAVKNALAWASKYRDTRYIDEQLRQMKIQHQRESMAHIANIENTRGFIRNIFSPTSTVASSFTEMWRRYITRPFKEVAADILASREEWAGITSGTGMEGITSLWPKSAIGALYEWWINPTEDLFGNELAVELIRSRKGYGQIGKMFEKIINLKSTEERKAKEIVKTSLPYFKLWNTGGTTKPENAREEMLYWQIAEEFFPAAIRGAPLEEKIRELEARYGTKIDIGKLKYVSQIIPRSTELGGKIEEFFLMGKNIQAFEASQIRGTFKDIGQEFLGKSWSRFIGADESTAIILKNLMVNPELIRNKSQGELESIILGEIRNLAPELANEFIKGIGGIKNLSNYVTDLAKNIKESSLGDVITGGAFSAKVKATISSYDFSNFRYKSTGELLGLFSHVYGTSKTAALDEVVAKMRKEGRSEEYIREQLLRGFDIFTKEQISSSIPTAPLEGAEKALSPEDWTRMAEAMKSLVKEMEKMSDKMKATTGGKK